MFKNIVKVDVIVNGRTYTILCDNDSPVVEFKEALFQFLKFAGSVEDRVKEAQEKAAQELPKEEPKQE